MWKDKRNYMIQWEQVIPVIRLTGSNTSIFSSKSRGSADILGNFAERFCFPNCGSCLRYFLAFSLRRNPRLESSGEPINFCAKGKQNALVLLRHVLVNFTEQKQMNYARDRESNTLIVILQMEAPSSYLGYKP